MVRDFKLTLHCDWLAYNQIANDVMEGVVKGFDGSAYAMRRMLSPNEYKRALRSQGLRIVVDLPLGDNPYLSE